MFLLQLVYDGEIMIPMPAWVSYLPQARIVGHQVNTIMTSYENSWEITPISLKQSAGSIQEEQDSSSLTILQTQRHLMISPIVQNYWAIKEEYLRDPENGKDTHLTAPT